MSADDLLGAAFTIHYVYGTFNFTDYLFFWTYFETDGTISQVRGSDIGNLSTSELRAPWQIRFTQGRRAVEFDHLMSRTMPSRYHRSEAGTKCRRTLIVSLKINNRSKILVIFFSHVTIKRSQHRCRHDTNVVKPRPRPRQCPQKHLPVWVDLVPIRP